jgi:hypothetical protein
MRGDMMPNSEIDQGFAKMLVLIGTNAYEDTQTMAAKILDSTSGTNRIEAMMGAQGVIGRLTLSQLNTLQDEIQPPKSVVPQPTAQGHQLETHPLKEHLKYLFAGIAILSAVKVAQDRLPENEKKNNMPATPLAQLASTIGIMATLKTNSQVLSFLKQYLPQDQGKPVDEMYQSVVNRLNTSIMPQEDLTLQDSTMDYEYDIFTLLVKSPSSADAVNTEITEMLDRVFSMIEGSLGNLASLDPSPSANPDETNTANSTGSGAG